MGTNDAILDNVHSADDKQTFATFPNVSWSTSELRVRLAPGNYFKPSS